MPSKISSREVLAYLNDLGYNNINAQQLKEFIQDLKKLIKYEERRRFKDTLESDLSPVRDIFSLLHAQDTCASKARAVPKKESVISLQIKKSKCPCHHKEKIDDEPAKSNAESTKTTSSKKRSSSRTRSSFIRPTVRVNNKSDPVALYHWYQEGWKRQKVPGEDNRADLRWAIREKMSRGPSATRG